MLPQAMGEAAASPEQMPAPSNGMREQMSVAAAAAAAKARASAHQTSGGVQQLTQGGSPAADGQPGKQPDSLSNAANGHAANRQTPKQPAASVTAAARGLATPTSPASPATASPASAQQTNGNGIHSISSSPPPWPSPVRVGSTSGTGSLGVADGSGNIGSAGSSGGSSAGSSSRSSADINAIRSILAAHNIGGSSNLATFLDGSQPETVVADSGSAQNGKPSTHHGGQHRKGMAPSKVPVNCAVLSNGKHEG